MANKTAQDDDLLIKIDNRWNLTPSAKRAISVANAVHRALASNYRSVDKTLGQKLTELDDTKGALAAERENLREASIELAQMGNTIQDLKSEIEEIKDDVELKRHDFNRESERRATAERRVKELEAALQDEQNRHRQTEERKEFHKSNYLRAMGYLDRVREEQAGPVLRGPRMGDDLRGEGYGMDYDFDAIIRGR